MSLRRCIFSLWAYYRSATRPPWRDPGTVFALPADLTPPVAVALARAVERIPGPTALPGGCLYEPKWDGYLH